MRLMTFSPHVLALALTTPFVLTSCSVVPGTTSDPKVTEIPQTGVKMQSIGNCWAYAVVGWAESMHLMATGKKINISESYISYWSTYVEIVEGGGKLASVREAGSWHRARMLLLDFGWLEEGDFIPEEATEGYSKRQEAAMEYLNQQLKPGGRLYGPENFNDRTILKELDTAFGVDGIAAKKRAKKAADLIVGKKDKTSITLADVLENSQTKWTEILYPQGINGVEVAPHVQDLRLNIIRRVQKALNDKMPVLISFNVAMGLIDPADGMFKMSRYTGESSLGRTGGHMVVLTDYVVDDVPGVGTIEEGEVSQELKDKALEGRVRYFVAKNSWGTDRAERGLTDGYTRLDMDYLDTKIPWPREGKKPHIESALMDVVLPPGY